MLKKFGRLKEIAKGGAIAVTSAVLVASVAAACTSIAHSPLDHQPKFTITNTISSSSTTQTPALLYPGVSRYLWYTAHNPLTVPITVTTMSISSVTAPAGCPIVNLSYAATTFTGSLVVPAQGSNSVPVPISLFETHKNQDSCENTTFRFDFQGTATFNVVPSTSTLLSSSHNPSVVGQSVTYTATDLQRRLHHDLLQRASLWEPRRIVHSNLHTPDLPRDRNTSDHSSLHELRRELREFDVLGAESARPVDSKIGVDFDFVAQSFGRWLPRFAHCECFWHSFGPIRSNSDWNRQFLSRYTDHVTLPDRHGNPYCKRKSDDDHVYAAVGLRQPVRGL